MAEDYLCCDLYRSPNWPVWAPRLPTLSLNQNHHQTEQSLVGSLDGEKRFWSSPLSNRRGNDRPSVVPPAKAIKLPPEEQKAKESLKNGVISDKDAIGKTSEFKVPQGSPRRTTHRKTTDECNDHSIRKSATNDEGFDANARLASGRSSWRGSNIYKTCDCIDKGKISPILRLAEQTRAVSSPDPLHRPDNPRATVLSATAAQTLR